MAAFLLLARSAWAHDDGTPHPHIDPAIMTFSILLGTGAVSLLVGLGVYTFLLKRGIVRSSCTPDRWD